MVHGRRTRRSGARTAAHDRLALIDEGGVVVVTGAPLARDGDAIAAAVAAGTASTHVFGHAILEHAARGEHGIRGALAILAGDPRGDVDRVLADALVGELDLGGPGVALDPRWF
jgi:hypothetical protein